MTVLTIGHSTRGFDEFVSLLRAHRVERLADVRTIPRSRRHPHFSRESLQARLAGCGIAYCHFPGLGGLRRPRRGSPNTAWRNRSFRGYADHMETPEFGEALGELLRFSNAGVTVVMCAEAAWWRCHRALLADALCVREVTVDHILSAGPPQRHQLCEFARTAGHNITYAEDTLPDS